MSQKLFKIRLLQAARLGDRVCLAGSEILMPADAAYELVRDHRAELDNDADLPKLIACTRANGNRWVRPHTR